MHTLIYATAACLSAACFVRFPVKPKDRRETGSVCVQGWHLEHVLECDFDISLGDLSHSLRCIQIQQKRGCRQTHRHIEQMAQHKLWLGLCPPRFSHYQPVYIFSIVLYWSLLICLSVLMHFYLFSAFIHEKNSYSQTFFEACPTGMQPTNPSKYNLDFCLCTKSVIMQKGRNREKREKEWNKVKKRYGKSQ